MKYNVASLFAGVGGVCLGFKRASRQYNLTIANELDKHACTTYSYNFNHSLIEGDIEKILTPALLSEERNSLIKKLDELEEIVEKYITNYDINLIKEGKSKLRNGYVEKCVKKIPIELSKSLEKKVINAYEKNQTNNISTLTDYINTYLKIVEIAIAEEELTLRNEEWLKENLENFNLKKEKMLKKRIDILTAGFPCQAFSIAGERKGFSDHRGELFYSVVKYVKLLEEKGHGKPRILFLENVKNLVNHDKGNTFKVIQQELEKLGYKLKYKVLNTYKYTNLPQNRERIFILAFLNDKDFENFGSFDDIPQLNQSKNKLIENIKSNINYNLDDSNYYYTKEKYPNYFMTEQEFKNSGKDTKINLIDQINEMYEFYQVRRGMYVRKNASGVCPTLTANMGTGGHNVPLIKVNDGIRKLTPEECFNLQGFRIGDGYSLPSEVSNANLYKQAGNAVSVDVIELLAKKLFKDVLEFRKKT